MSAPKTSLSTASPPPSSPHRLPSDPSLIRPNGAANKVPPHTEALTIKVTDSLDGAVPGILHLPSSYDHNSTPTGGKDGKTPPPPQRTAAILLSGAGGGLVGPSSIYLGMATKLASLRQGIPTLRLDYRYPARNKYCVADVLAAMSHLENKYTISRFVLVGWSFGGAPVFTVGGSDRRVVGCATVASQTADTEGIRTLPPTPVLLLHGLKDRTLHYSCSRSLYERYGAGRGERELKLFEGDDHALTGHAVEAEERLCRFVMKCAGVKEADGERELVEGKLVDGKDRVRLMEKGGDLDGPENVE
ncbi:MAG: hypothetical protein LQ338_008256 [Usnochroma carphineum]|nr:MAG: hypothetical protein LQ338_008256 [Usnochroma carphineum]